ncbi:Polygalacturonase [Phytophthora palmivora]|uniref:Polygalacturonase n=1 Tax=Phytophthora palmivora TaxID=4796 RepID=A0A2P4YCW3_9STRA|nr:Polygalacturonase [Phytophthora palmivora]
MKLFASILGATAVVIAAVKGNPMIRQEAEEADSSSCTLSGTYTSGTDVSSCSTVTIKSLTVPAGVTLDLSDLKSGANVVFSGTTTFGKKRFWNA